MFVFKNQRYHIDTKLGFKMGQGAGEAEKKTKELVERMVRWWKVHEKVNEKLQNFKQ